MPTLSKTIDINAPAEKVFDILTDPHRVPELTPGFTRVEDIRQTEQHIGDSFRAIYSVVGLHIPMLLTVTEYERPTKASSRFEGTMKGTWKWRLEARGNSTHLMANQEYEMSGGILGKVMNAVIGQRLNEKTADQTLENLKRMSEAAPSMG